MADAAPAVLITGATSGLGRYLAARFFDGLTTSRARPEAYDPRFRARLRAVTDQMIDAAAAGSSQRSQHQS